MTELFDKSITISFKEMGIELGRAVFSLHLFSSLVSTLVSQTLVWVEMSGVNQHTRPVIHLHNPFSAFTALLT